MRFVFLTAAAVAAMSLTAPAGATGTSRITLHDRHVIRFFQHHPWLARTPAGAAVLARVLPRVIRSLQAADVAAANPYPPHHALWECIARYEAPHVAVTPEHPDGLDWSYGRGWRPAHGGGMGFHLDWGYGLVGSAGDYTQAEQEWAAERGYIASGYSWDFLNGQWYKWDAADGCGTTG